MISFDLWHTVESFPSPLYDRLNNTLCIKTNDSPSCYFHASYRVKARDIENVRSREYRHIRVYMTRCFERVTNRRIRNGEMK